ncbi:hypothetical protein [Sphingopyxis sp.]|jgi:hypothetical protein|uniref:hypothetical protein n=1 Tax=Sphingopyxis sp. TaxID=1908224 RepID=UPI002E044BE7|nr:hypothetical protein [Sphingopyxis sp.]
MRPWPVLAAVAAIFALPAGAQEMVGGHRIIRTADPAIWSGRDTSGPITHIATGTVFPESIGGFQRTSLMAVDNGNDVMLHYRLKRDPASIEVSTFLFQPGALAEHRLKGAITSLGYGRKDMTFLWADGPFDIEAPQKLRGFKATYKVGIGGDTALEYLYFIELGKWTAKVRATLPESKEPAEEGQIDAFVRALPWASILAANGACSGPACDGTRAMPFNNHMAEMFLTKIVASGQGKALLGDAAEPVYAREAGGKRWTLYPLDEKIVPLFTDVFGRISARAPLYSLSWSAKKENGVVRFFVGKPSEEAFTATVDGLVAHPETSAFIVPADAAAYASD